MLINTHPNGRGLHVHVHERIACVATVAAEHSRQAGFNGLRFANHLGQGPAGA